MQTWTTVDKSGWGDGPWLREFDKAHWVDSETDLDCLIVRNRAGALCGYVGVPEGHPWFEVDRDELDVDVHGGLTFSDRCDPNADEATDICHTPEPGRPEVWWLGFDTAHFRDYVPVYALDDLPGFTMKLTYRDVDYVTDQVRQLARQVRAATTG